MQVKFTENNEKVANAVKLANDLLNNPLFYEKIAKHNKFDKSDASPEEIAKSMKNSNAVIQVELYQSLNPFSRSNGYVTSKKPGVLHLNTRRLERSEGSIAATIIHECVHAVDETDTAHQFGHGSNSSEGKENTAPYWIDNLAYSMLTDKKPKIVFQTDSLEKDMQYKKQ